MIFTLSRSAIRCAISSAEGGMTFSSKCGIGAWITIYAAIDSDRLAKLYGSASDELVCLWQYPQNLEERKSHLVQGSKFSHALHYH